MRVSPAIAAALAVVQGRTQVSGVAAPTTEYASKKAPFDNSPAAVAARKAAREAKLEVLAPTGMKNANFVMKPDVDGILAVATRVGTGKGSKADRAAVSAVVDRIRSNSLRLTEGAKKAAGMKPYAFAELVEQTANLA